MNFYRKIRKKRKKNGADCMPEAEGRREKEGQGRSTPERDRGIQ